jgi:tetratricopeptide (TPR) repeat protein
VIASSLDANKKDVSLLMIDADLNRRQNKTEQVLADYQRATEAAPKNFKVWQSWSEFQEHNGHVAEAEQVLNNSIKAVPDDSTRRIALVNLITRHEGESAGLKALQSMNEDRPHDYLIGFALSDYYTSKGEIASAREVLGKIEHSDGKGISGMRARNELAALDLASGDVAKARSATDDILKIDPRDSAALLLRGRIELSDNQIDAAIADFRGAARDKPDSVQVLALLAKAYDLKKQPDLARDTLADAAKLYPNHPEIALLQMQYLESSNHVPDALSAADDAMRRNPNNFDLIKAKVGLQEKNKDFTGAEQTLVAWQSTHPNDANATMQLGRVYALDNKLDNALAQYDRAALIAPASFDSRAAALQLLISSKKYAEAQKRVDADIAKAPNSAVNYQLRGDVLSAEGDNAGAETAYRRAIEVEPTAVTAYLNLANFQTSQHRLDDAKATFDAGLTALPKNSLLETTYADFLTKTQQYDAAIGLFEQMLAELPSNAAAANNLAFILTQFKGDPKSLERAAVLTKGFEYSTNPSFLDTVGWTDYKLGKYDEAVGVYQRAALMAPNSAALQMRYGMALYKSGATAAAQDHLRLASKSGGKLPDDAQQMLAKG